MLGAIVCGMEHSGTTLVSDLLRQTGRFESGFECGVLLTNSPRQFPELEPFYGFMADGWAISPADLRRACDTDDFNEFYSLLSTASPLIRADQKVFDKTPRYITQFDAVASRSNAPIIVIYKDPRASVFSDWKRSGVADFDAWFETYVDAKRNYMASCYRGYERARAMTDRAVTLSLEALCFDSRRTCEQLFAHLRVPFSLQYMMLEDLRYANTKGAYVSPSIVMAYSKGLTVQQQQTVARAFADYQDWFYE